ncbi:acyltransferase domain-containing protein [Streptomyces sp. NPDC050095]|uniref:ACP S-malonyltransferase n=1 Tax=unclassified Streptomyces TaxID=2593676 RepID=UPI00341FD46F
MPGALAQVGGHPAVRSTLSEVDEAVAAAYPGPLPSSLLLGASEERTSGASGSVEVALHLAVYTQALALFRLLLATEDMRPATVLGHSLGDIAALAAVGTVTAGDGAKLLLAAEAARRRHRVPPGGLLALRLSASDTARLLREQSLPGLRLACDNAPRQSVVCGPAEQLDALSAAARGRSVKTVRVATRTLFHSPVLRAVADDVRDVAARLPFATPRFPVRSAAPVPPPRHPAALRDAVTHHLTRPVCFRQTTSVLALAGTTVVIEAAPRLLLTPLMKAVAPAFTVRTVLSQPPVPSDARGTNGTIPREGAGTRADPN